MTVRLSLALIGVALLAAAARAEPKISKADLRAILEAARKKHDVPALGAAVVTSGGLVELAVTGVRKRGDKQKATEADRFHLGSDTKAMTAALIAQLVRKKQLSYDRTMAEAFPDLAEKMPEPLRRATLRQCLTHRAGLPANLAWEKIPTGEGILAQREAALRQLLGEKLPAAPGEKFLYSNTGYVIAALMAERATKTSWEALLAEHVTRPLKMTAVGHGAMGTPGKVDQPWPHTADGEPIEPGPRADNPPVMGPAGNVHCPLADWARFIADQLKGARGKGGLLPAEAYKVLHTPAAKGEEYTPGGWLYREGPGGVLLAHDGSNTLNYATAMLLPRPDLAVLVVCNQGGDAGRKACAQAREAIFSRLLGK